MHRKIHKLIDEYENLGNRKGKCYHKEFLLAAKWTICVLEKENETKDFNARS